MKGICVIKSEKVNAIIKLTEQAHSTVIKGSVTGLNPNQEHAIHIHECGDLSDGCTSACAHYNPFNKNHGGPRSNERHVGDLGNIMADNNGNCEFIIHDLYVRLSGEYSVIGRSIIIHEDPDDYGLGGYEDSHTTGHAGKRIGCGVIGITK